MHIWLWFATQLVHMCHRTPAAPNSGCPPTICLQIIMGYLSMCLGDLEQILGVKSTVRARKEGKFWSFVDLTIEPKGLAEGHYQGGQQTLDECQTNATLK